jgi:predicted dehydrogenase
MMRVGIIGAENSHTIAIAKILNVEEQVKGFTVACVWGETDELAKKAAEAGQIPEIVKKPKDMLGKVDAIVVDHRHAKYHLKAALPFVKEGIPAFIDKPFCYRSDEGREFLKEANKAGAPVTSFGVVPHQGSFLRFARKVDTLAPLRYGYTWGACDLRSKWGGVFFYGIHQVECVLQAFGYDVQAVRVTKSTNTSVGEVLYSSGLTITMGLIKDGAPGFGIGAVGSKGSLHQPITMDKSQYLRGVKEFCKMFKTRERPLTDEQLLKPVQVLEALEQSVKSGELVKVAS